MKAAFPDEFKILLSVNSIAMRYAGLTLQILTPVQQKWENVCMIYLLNSRSDSRN